MKKSDKKLDNQLRKALTIACESIKDTLSDFNWLTHQVDYNQYPQSLVVRCYIDNQRTLDELILNPQQVQQVISRQLQTIGIKNFNADKQIHLALDD